MQLLVLRHAKSSWDDPSLADVDRPLNQRGERAAGLMAAWLAGSGLEPQVVWCSPALRTRQTLDRLRPALAAAAAAATVSVSVSVEPWLYGAGPEDVVEMLRTLDGSVGSVLVIGHNPTMGDLAFELAGSGDVDLRERLAERFPTAALAVLDFELASWDELAAGAGRLSAYVRPVDLA